MGRFFIVTAFIGLVGFLILGSFDPDLAGTLVMFIAGIIISAVFVKVALDIYLHYRKKDVDEDFNENNPNYSSPKTYYDINDYRKSRQKHNN